MGPAKIPLIGIAGGIASGKSFIAQQLGRQGAALVSADEIAHEVLKLADVKALARERWGDAIFASDGQIDRQSLGRIVFAAPPDGPRELRYLEGLTHPTIGELIRERIAAIHDERHVPAIVLDVPLLFESHWNEFCTKVIFVDAPRDVRLARAAARGWSPAEFARREATQESLESKRLQADIVIDNSGSPESAQSQVALFWKSLVSSSLSN
jgi:dephospho-CoA kinase